MENLAYEIDKAISKASKQKEMENLTGESLEFDPYEKVIRRLKDGIEQAKFLQAHVHEWDENGYCVYCAADGNA